MRIMLRSAVLHVAGDPAGLALTLCKASLHLQLQQESAHAPAHAPAHVDGNALPDHDAQMQSSQRDARLAHVAVGNDDAIERAGLAGAAAFEVGR